MFHSSLSGKHACTIPYTRTSVRIASVFVFVVRPNVINRLPFKCNATINMLRSTANGLILGLPLVFLPNALFLFSMIDVCSFGDRFFVCKYFKPLCTSTKAAVSVEVSIN